MSYLFQKKKKNRSKRKPNQGGVILEEKQRGSMGSLALLGSLLNWAYFSILRFVGLDFEPRLFSMTMPFSSPVGPFLFLHFFFSFSTRLGHLSSSSPFFFAALSGPLFYSFFAAWSGFLLLLLFGLDFVALSLYIKYF
jgi:hypothetical protein